MGKKAKTVQKKNIVEKVGDVLTGKAKAKKELTEIKAKLFDINLAKEKLSGKWNQLSAVEKTLVAEANKRIYLIEGKKVDGKKKKETPKTNKS